MFGFPIKISSPLLKIRLIRFLYTLFSKHERGSLGSGHSQVPNLIKALPASLCHFLDVSCLGVMIFLLLYFCMLQTLIYITVPIPISPGTATYEIRNGNGCLFRCCIFSQQFQCRSVSCVGRGTNGFFNTFLQLVNTLILGYCLDLMPRK